MIFLLLLSFLFGIINPSFAMDDDSIIAAPGMPSGGGGATCNTIPGTSIAYGTGCFASQVGSCPALVNQHDPINFGADSTGANDSTSAISQAWAAGTDVYFGTAGTYKLNGCADCSSTPGVPWSYCTGAHACSGVTNVGTSGGAAFGIVPPAGAQIQCAPGVVLTWNITTSPVHDLFMILLRNNNNTICGCNIQGAQVGSPPYAIINTNLAEIGITQGSGALIEDDVFSKGTGNGMIKTVQDYGGASSNVTISWNDFSKLPYYGVVNDGVTNTMTVSHNGGLDTTFGTEWDACGSSSLGTAINYFDNYEKSTVGHCEVPNTLPCNNPGFRADHFGPGFTENCNLAGLTIGPNNYCEGTASHQSFVYNATGAQAGGSGSNATTTNNILGPNCSCSPNSPC